MHPLFAIEAGVEAAPHFPFSATALLVVGFIAAVSLGSIAWYNSKRPVGWEDKERPDVVPEIEKG